MTMRIKITNEDQNRAAVVKVREHSVAEDGTVGAGNVAHAETRRVKPGASSDFWIHKTRTLLVEEGDCPA